MKFRFFGFLILVFCILNLVASVSALTASIGNARMILNTEVKAGTPTVLQKSIKVINLNNVSVDVTLTPSGDIKSFTEILDKSLTLKPNESKDARFVMTLQFGGRYDGKILVNFKPSQPNLKATPVGLASTIIIIAQGPKNPNPPSNDSEPYVPSTPGAASTPSVVPGQEPNNETGPAATSTQGPSSPAKTGITGTGTKNADPIVGIVIILIVLAIGSIIYWWYMKR